MRIIHKGLLMVSVPLIFELIFGAQMFFMQRDLQDLTARESRSKQIVIHLNQLFMTFLDLVVSSYLVRISALGEIRMPSGYLEKLETSIGADIAALDQFYATDFDSRKRFLTLKTTLRNFQKYTDSVDIGASNGGSVELSLGSIKELQIIQATSVKLRKAVDALRQQETEYTRVVSRKIEKLSKELSLLICVGILANVLIAGLMVIFLARSITSRLAVLVDNSRRLATNEELLAPIAGRDELTDLDMSFHASFRKLRETELLKRDFYHMVAHDLRSPLSAVKMIVEMVQARTYGDISDDASQRLAMCDRNLSKILHLVNDILELDKLKAGKMPIEKSMVQAHDLVVDTIKSIQPLADAKHVQLVEAVEPFMLSCDGKRVVQSLMNLGANAIKFSRPNTTVTLVCQKKGNEAVFAVKDEGRGIPPADLDRLFDRFAQVETADGAYGVGTGLGLSICKMIAEAHGGRMSAESTEGKGSTFLMHLPLGEQSVSTAAPD